MADVIKTKNTLSLEQEFTDGDTRTITLDNPSPTITAAAINEISEFNKLNQCTKGDKAGANFLRFRSAKITVGSTTYLDLTPA